MDAFLDVVPVVARDHLAACLHEHDAAARRAAQDLGRDRGLRIRVGDDLIALATTGGGVELDPVEMPERTVDAAMAAEDFSALAVEAWSMPGLLYNGRLDIPLERWGEALAWDPLLQAVLFDRPTFDASAVPADAGSRSFDVDTEFDAAADDLAVAGFVHLRGVFSAAEVDELRRAVAPLIAAADPDDGRSWWTTDPNGIDRCCRITYAASGSTLLAALADRPVMARIAALGRRELRPAVDRMDGINCVIKVPKARAGLVDLPWHRDCGNGGHPLICPGLNIGIQLDPADAERGQLSFIPGSHHHAGPRNPADERLRHVAIDAEPGDVTVHAGHCLHIAPPPTGSGEGRRALYCGFYKPELFDVIGPGQSFNDVVLQHGGRIKTPDQLG